MGIFIDRALHVYSPVNLNIDDPATISGLVCHKTAELLFQHFVERTDTIAGLVLYQGVRPADVGAGIQQLSLLFSDANDVANTRAGMPLDWLDCSTRFIDLTPNTTLLPGAPTPTTYLRLAVGQPGTLGGSAVPVRRSLLA